MIMVGTGRVTRPKRRDGVVNSNFEIPICFYPQNLYYIGLRN